MGPLRHRSIFSPAGVRERAENFEDYWLYTQRNDGEIIEDQRDLTRKRELRARLQARAVRSRAPLADPDTFYRNCVELHDDPRTLDRKTLLLTFLYKFARHEWVGILHSAAGVELEPVMVLRLGQQLRIIGGVCSLGAGWNVADHLIRGREHRQD